MSIASFFDGSNVKHVSVNKPCAPFTSQQGWFDRQVSCQVGVPNIDNGCVCQGSFDTNPSYAPVLNMNYLFTPYQEFTSPTKSMKFLINQRSPGKIHADYEYTLGMGCDKK